MSTETDRQALRYPIGTRTPRTSFSSASRQAAIDEIASLPDSLWHAVAGLSDVQLDTPYRPAGWTVRQVVHHLADAHVVIYARVKIALTEHEPPVTLWDEIEWAELPDAKTMAIHASLAILDAVHARLVHLLNLLSPGQFERTLRHPVWGTIPVDELVEICAWHGRHHVAHVRALRTRCGW